MIKPKIHKKDDTISKLSCEQLNGQSQVLREQISKLKA